MRAVRSAGLDGYPAFEGEARSLTLTATNEARGQSPGATRPVEGRFGTCTRKLVSPPGRPAALKGASHRLGG